MLKLKFILHILIIFLSSLKICFAQEISSSSSKNYETKTIKKNNEIEIRLIPKNPPPKIEKKLEPKQSIAPDEIIENHNKTENNNSISSEIQEPKEPEIIYEKKAEENNLSSEEVNSIQVQNANLVRENSLKLWREEQRKMREERIKARHEESRKKYQALKEKNVIKEMENANKNSKENKNSKNSMVNYYDESIAPTTLQNQNSNAIPTNANTTNTDGARANDSSNSISNATNPLNQNNR